MKEKTLIVISDIHIGAGDLDGFSEEIEKHFCDFLLMLQEKKSSVELIINGDFLEFIQAPPWEGSDLESKTRDGIPLCFTEVQSIAKLEAIYNAHKNTFSAIKDFLKAKPENIITIIPGNHDADFFWGRVRGEFIQMVCGSEIDLVSQIYFHLKQVYRPVSFSSIWIEHGHQYDPINSFFLGGVPIWNEDIPPIFLDDTGEYRLFECVGTRFLVKFVNKLNKAYPFIKSIKPIDRLLSFALSTIKKEYGLLKIAVAFWNLLRYLDEISLDYSMDILSISNSNVIDPRPVLNGTFLNMTRTDKLDLLKVLEEYDLFIYQPIESYISNRENAIALMDVFSIHPEILDRIEIIDSKDLGFGDFDFSESLSFGKGIVKNQSKVLYNQSKIILKNEEIQSVIMGHTHNISNCSKQKYINIGSWTRNYDTERMSNVELLSIFKENSLITIPYKLGYTKVEFGRNVSIDFNIYCEFNND